MPLTAALQHDLCGAYTVLNGQPTSSDPLNWPSVAHQFFGLMNLNHRQALLLLNYCCQGEQGLRRVWHEQEGYVSLGRVPQTRIPPAPGSWRLCYQFTKPTFNTTYAMHYRQDPTAAKQWALEQVVQDDTAERTHTNQASIWSYLRRTPYYPYIVWEVVNCYYPDYVHPLTGERLHQETLAVRPYVLPPSGQALTPEHLRCFLRAISLKKTLDPGYRPTLSLAHIRTWHRLERDAIKYHPDLWPAHEAMFWQLYGLPDRR